MNLLSLFQFDGDGVICYNGNFGFEFWLDYDAMSLELEAINASYARKLVTA